MPAALPARSRRHHLALALILALAAFVRLWTIGWGTPYGVSVDEPDIMSRVVTMLKTGSFNPHFWDYGGVTFYLQLVVAVVRFLLGARSGDWSSLSEVWEGDFYLAGRIVTALVGVFTVWIVYRCALRWGVTVALVAALAMAIQPHHVRESQFALTDTPLVFLVALTMLVSLRASEEGRLRWFWIAGITAGLATATKYPGLLAALMPLVAALASRDARLRWTAIGASIGGTVLGFALGEPYAFITLGGPQGFLNGFAGLMQHYNAPTSGLPESPLISYLKYIEKSFGWAPLPGLLSPYYLGWLGTTITIVGAVFCLSQIRRRSMRAPTVILLVFPIAFLAFLANQSLVFARYILPIMPMVTIAFGSGVVVIADLLAPAATAPIWRRPALIGALSIPLVLQFATVTSFNLKHRQYANTINQAGDWLTKNVAPEEKIASEAEGLRLPAPFVIDVQPRLARPVDWYRQMNFVYLVVSSSKNKPAPEFRQLLNNTTVIWTFPGNELSPTVTILRLNK